MRIFLYGDSLVYGKKPGSVARYERTERFAGVIEDTLGSAYEVVEEGLRARMLVGENSFFPDRDGLKQFGSILGSHVPLDVVVIMLGTNDCNSTSKKTDEEIERALQGYCELVPKWYQQLGLQGESKILMVAPPRINSAEIMKDPLMTKLFGSEAEEKWKRLASVYERFCQKKQVAFFDAATACVSATGEGIHLDEENNRKLGLALAKEIQKLLAM